MALPAATVTLLKCDDGHGVTMLDATGRGNSLTPNTVPAVSSEDFSVFKIRFDGSQTSDARIARFRLFGTLLTGAERTAVYNSGSGVAWGSLSGAIQAKALASWQLGEASAAASFADDTANARTLTAQGAGLVQVATAAGNGQDNGAGSSYAWRSNTGMGGGLGDLEYSMFVQLDSLTPPTGQVHFLAGIADGGSKWSHCLYYNRHSADASGRFQFDVGDGAALANLAVVRAQTFGAPAASTLYHVGAWYDYTNNKLGISVNDGTADEVYPVAQPAMRTALISTGLAAGFTSGNAGFATGGLETNGIYDDAGQHYARKVTPGADLKFTNGASKMGGCWLKLASTSGNQVVAGIWDLSGNAGNWMLQYSGGRIYFLVGNGAGSFDYADVSLNDTNAHCLMWWFDAGTGFVHIDRDHAAETDSTAKTVTIADPGTPFYLGAMRSGGGHAQQLEGAVDAFFLADGVPTSQEKDDYWNAGSGTETLAGSVTPSKSFPLRSPVRPRLFAPGIAR
jgi:hypothetical protein